MVPAVPGRVKVPRARVAKDETVKRRPGRPPKTKKPPSSKVTTKRATAAIKTDSPGENFDISGFTDLDDSENEVERWLQTQVGQGK